MSPFPSFEIKNVEFSELRFTTAGDWEQTSEDHIVVYLVKVNDPRYSAIVLAHEMTEIIYCWWKGVTGKEADAFDAIWEEELKRGLHKPEEEAGFDKRCPYRRGHQLGYIAERIFCWILRVKWKKYCADWDKFFQENHK